MAAVADVRRRVLMVSGAIDVTDHDVSVCLNLPEPGRWQVIKSETNLTDQTWVAMQVTCDEDSHFVNDADTLVLSRQFAKTLMTPAPTTPTRVTTPAPSPATTPATAPPSTPASCCRPSTTRR